MNRKITSVAQVAVISSPENCNKEVEEVKREIMKLIDPGTERIKIKGVRKRMDGKIVVETATAEDLAKVIGHKNLISGGFTAIRSGAMNPKVIVYDVPRELEAEDIADNLFYQNEDLLQGIEQEEFKRSFIPKFRIGKRDGQCTNWVAEVTPKLRNILRRNKRVRLYLMWQSCKVEDYRGVTRCYKCQLYGHVSKYCREEEQTCSFCSKKGHIHEKCPDKERKALPTCTACKNAKKKSDHSVNDKACPMYKIALERIIARTNYGN